MIIFLNCLYDSRDDGQVHFIIVSVRVAYVHDLYDYNDYRKNAFALFRNSDPYSPCPGPDLNAFIIII